MPANVSALVVGDTEVPVAIGLADDEVTVRAEQDRLRVGDSIVRRGAVGGERWVLAIAGHRRDDARRIDALIRSLLESAT
ncbi:MAG: hypothetical protein R3C32_03185 [Chloroflexota bacterium]